MADSHQSTPFRVLVFGPHYVPFVKGGGPIVSLKNIVRTCGHLADFWILTADRDLGDLCASPTVETGRWESAEGAHVYRQDPARIRICFLRAMVREAAPDVLYLNSVFNYRFSILPLAAHLLGVLRAERVVLAPRGELYPGALSISSAKKKAFLLLARLVGLYRRVVWQATSEAEGEQIRRVFGARASIIMAGNIGRPPAELQPVTVHKVPGALRLCFVSRITEKKGLLTAIKCLEGIVGNLTLDIYGPIENEIYWGRCKEALERLPANITVRWHGVVDEDGVESCLRQSHVLILPTLGENYGHVIGESLGQGRPVIISDQTPWQNVEECGVGRVMSLSVEQFARAVQDYVDMEGDAYRVAARDAWAYAREVNDAAESHLTYAKLFRGSPDCGTEQDGDQ